MLFFEGKVQSNHVDKCTRPMALQYTFLSGYINTKGIYMCHMVDKIEQKGSIRRSNKFRPDEVEEERYEKRVEKIDSRRSKTRKLIPMKEN